MNTNNREKQGHKFIFNCRMLDKFLYHENSVSLLLSQKFLLLNVRNGLILIMNYLYTLVGNYVRRLRPKEDIRVLIVILGVLRTGKVFLKSQKSTSVALFVTTKLKNRLSSFLIKEMFPRCPYFS